MSRIPLPESADLPRSVRDAYEADDATRPAPTVPTEVREALLAVRYALATKGTTYVEAVLRELDSDTPPDIIVRALLNAPTEGG